MSLSFIGMESHCTYSFVCTASSVYVKNSNICKIWVKTIWERTDIATLKLKIKHGQRQWGVGFNVGVGGG